ncbi:precorrin-3B synthase [Azospirillum fermentarium]|uniref:precorrin-3B synthase n=1 Tax=Azospirillum fermentarium TaxID=1233114 RepID=UPI002227B48B|nr:precorrin-3B synthase [Azospirillum fermentarium]MCW2249157.1 precorrin-3B synthase [Azospirillum fermentarium]
MMMAASPAQPRRRGYCPGVLAPMEVGDGLLVRVRVPAGILTAAQARRIAALGRELGNGLVDLSHRGNLQLRGLDADGLPPLYAALESLGLLAADVESEAVRNVLTAPAAGLDPQGFDVRAAALALDARLAADAAVRGLTPKFGWLVCGGGVGHLADSSTDVRFDAVADGAGFAFRVALGGTLATAVPIGLCAPAGLPAVAAAIARTFIALRAARDGAPRRMAGLVRETGAGAFAALPGLTPLADAAPPVRAPRAVLGVQSGWLGVAFPFGRLDVDRLDALAGLAERQGCGEIRLTPWRALLLPGVADGTEIAALGGVLDPADVRLRLTACSGAGGCDVGTTDTHADALALARRAPALAAAAGAVHVSGCSKGCAHPAPAAVTLTARAGRYGVDINAAASGAARWPDLSPAEAVDKVAALDALYRQRAEPGVGAEAFLATLAPADL